MFFGPTELVVLALLIMAVAVAFGKLSPAARAWLAGIVIGVAFFAMIIWMYSARRMEGQFRADARGRLEAIGSEFRGESGSTVGVSLSESAPSPVARSGRPSWMGLLVFGLVTVLLLTGLVYLFQKLTPSGRRWLGGGIAVFALLIFGFVFSYDSVQQVPRAETVVHEPFDEPQRRIEVLASDTANKSSAATNDSSDSADESVDPGKPVAPIVTEPDPNLPDWAKEPPHKQDDAYFVVVHSGTFSHPGMREEALEVKMKAAADRYIDEILYRQGDVAQKVGIDANYLKQHAVAEQYESSDVGGEMYAQLKFDKRFRDEVARRHQEAIAAGRVKRLGAITLGVLGAIGASLVVLRAAGGRQQAAGGGE